MSIPLLRCGPSSGAIWTPADAAVTDFWFHPADILPQVQDDPATSWVNRGIYEATVNTLDEQLANDDHLVDLRGTHAIGNLEGGLILNTDTGGFKSDGDMTGFGYEPTSGAVGWIVTLENYLSVSGNFNAHFCIGDNRWTGWDIRFGVGKFGATDPLRPTLWLDMAANDWVGTIDHAGMVDKNDNPPFPSYSIVWHSDGVSTMRGWVDNVEYDVNEEIASIDFDIGDWFQEMRAGSGGSNAHPRRICMNSAVKATGYTGSTEIHEVVILGTGTTGAEAESLAAYLHGRATA